MRIEQLRYFSTLIQYKSITKASEALFITPQALSASIKSLEQELNVVLLLKDHSGIKLTEEGKKISQTINEILELCDKLYTYTTCSQNTTLQGRLSLAATPLVNSLFISENIHDFLSQYPLINLSIQEHRVTDYFNNISTYAFDLALIHLPSELLDRFIQKYTSQFSIQKLMEDKLAIICNKNHPLAHKRTVSYNTAVNYPFAILQSKDNLLDFYLEDSINKSGFPEKYSIFPNTFYITEYLAQNANAVAIAFRNTFKFASPSLSSLCNDLIAVPLRDSITMQILSLAPKNETTSPVIQTYLNFLRKKLL